MTTTWKQRVDLRAAGAMEALRAFVETKNEAALARVGSALVALAEETRADVSRAAIEVRTDYVELGTKIATLETRIATMAPPELAQDEPEVPAGKCVICEAAVEQPGTPNCRRCWDMTMHVARFVHDGGLRARRVLYRWAMGLP
jgi:hypothetical protein